MFKVNTINTNTGTSYNILLPNVNLLQDGDYISFNFTSANGGSTIFYIKDSTGTIVAQTGGTTNSGGTIRTVAYQASTGSWWLVD